MKIVIFEFEPWERPFFERLHQGHDVHYETHPLDVATAGKYSDADIVSVFVYSTLDQEVLSQFKHLQLIATRSTGFDHIDIEYCKNHNIRLSNVPVYGENTVAEHVFALLLAISHRIPEAVNRTRTGDFSQQGLQGFDLRGRTMGVIGAGNIGRKVIKIARGFEMNVLAYDTQADEDLARELGFTYADLSHLLQQSDVITLHVPGNKSTQNLISEREFAQMKDGIIVINTARGSVMDVKALLHALADGKVAAAGLDVLPEEPVIREEAELLRSFFTKKHDLETLLADHVLLHMRNVIITPHSAFNTREAVQRIINTTVANIECFLKQASQNIVV